ncbi:MAG: hypothetical protein ABI852_20345, partial [Gemmatimonadaceae bacterium]
MTARTRLLGMLFLAGFITQPTAHLLDRAARWATASEKCADVSQAMDAKWQGTGEWRALAPYPMPREASPTKTVGVWLERWHLENGSTELRRVSAQQTDVASLDA